MSWFARVLRLLVGGGLVAGGAVLAQPFVQTVLAVRQQGAAAVGGAADMDAWRAPLPGMQAPPDGGVPWPVGTAPVQPPQGAALGVASAGFPAQGGGIEGPSVMPSSRQPPMPPTPLPRSAIDVGPTAPPLDSAYRSTLDIPPPPLLDTQTPPPLAVGWSAHDTIPRPAAAPVTAAEPPSTYVVRDGDDLTGIALRVHGSAAAASAIWAANRDLLADPQLLPIGMVLRMPPSWTLPSAHAGQAGGHSIEPTFGAAAPTAASWRSTRPAAERAGAGAAWLQQPDGPSAQVVGDHPASARGAVEQPPQAAGPQPTTVRIAAGDTLESIAVRVYGDRTAAARIWQANRDRLRSPDLLVPGTDLRLP